MRNLLPILSIILCFSSVGKAQEVDFATMNAKAQACENLLSYREAFGYYQYCLQMDTTNTDILNALARIATNLGERRAGQCAY